MNAQELQNRIDAFPRWRYRFEFEQGISTPATTAAWSTATSSAAPTSSIRS